MLTYSRSPTHVYTLTHTHLWTHTHTYIHTHTHTHTHTYSDYRAIPELDVYDARQLDDSQTYSELSVGARMEAERDLRNRDREELAATGRVRPALLYGS